MLSAPVASVAPSVPVDLRVAEFSRGNQTTLGKAFDLQAYNRSGGAYRAASICMVPAGDVLSSRRNSVKAKVSPTGFQVAFSAIRICWWIQRRR